MTDLSDLSHLINIFKKSFSNEILDISIHGQTYYIFRKSAFCLRKNSTYILSFTGTRTMKSAGIIPKMKI